jgi:hypothetical protein
MAAPAVGLAVGGAGRAGGQVCDGASDQAPIRSRPSGRLVNRAAPDRSTDRSHRHQGQALPGSDRAVQHHPILTGLAVPGRPIGPWSRKTGAPESKRQASMPMAFWPGAELIGDVELDSPPPQRGGQVLAQRQKERIVAFSTIDAQPTSHAGPQPRSLLALSSGVMTGTGLGCGKQLGPRADGQPGWVDGERGTTTDQDRLPRRRTGKQHREDHRGNNQDHGAGQGERPPATRWEAPRRELQAHEGCREVRPSARVRPAG